MATKKETNKRTPANLIELELEDAKTGKTQKVNACIADSFPSVRPLRGQNVIVKSDDLMALALGNKLDESTQKAFDQLGFGKDQAIAFIEKLVISGSAMAKIEK